MRHIPLGVSIIPSARTVYHGAVGSVGASTRLSGPAQARKIENQTAGAALTCWDCSSRTRQKPSQTLTVTIRPCALCFTSKNTRPGTRNTPPYCKRTAPAFGVGTCIPQPFGFASRLRYTFI